MNIRSSLPLTFLTITIVSSNLVLLVSPLADKTSAAQIDQSLPSTNKADSRFKLKLNTLFKNGKVVTQQDTQDNLNIVWSLFGGNLSRAQELGFGTDPTAAKPSLTPFPIFHVSLKDLRDFTPGKEAFELLVFTNKLLFPIEINNKVTSSITLRFREPQEKTDQKNKETGWLIARWGLPKLIKQLTTELPPNTEGALVSIPSLNRNFLAYFEDDDTNFKLVPLVSDRLFKAGKPLSANEVFMSLVPEAKSIDDSPR